MRLRSPNAPSMRLTGGQYLSGPEQPGRRRPRERGLLARVRARPLGDHDVGRGMRRVAQRTVVDRPLPRLDGPDLVADGDHRVAEAVELGEVFRFGRLDHERARHRERDRGRVEPEVDQALGDVVGGHPGALRDRAQVEDALVRDESARAAVEHRVVRREPRRDVVGGEDGGLGGAQQAVAAHQLDVRVRDREDAGRSVGRGGDVRRQERREVRAHRDRADARASPTVGDAERLVQVEVRHVGAERAGLRRARRAR